ncbi:MAG TPA: cation:proton antiporter [Oligoflexia bacterium]|nr:cation:proton antiporter [Oligoflexia bacterium]HMP48701.1 cation:proton antiporter [Oligoflexia bacterium]
MSPIGSTHVDIQTFLLQVGLLLFFARLFGQVCSRFGQPSVIGEIVAGIVLGPSFFGLLFPDLSVHFLPTTDAQLHLLEGISLLGVLFLLFITGLEIDIPLIYRQIRVSLGVAFGGLILPLFGGYILGINLPDHVLVSQETRQLTASFFAVAFAISAIPVVARVLLELKIIRRDVSQTLFAAAMIDDAVGWILLSSLVGIAASGAFSLNSLMLSLLSVIGLALLSLTLGRFIVSKLLDFIFNKEFSDGLLSYLISLIFIWAWFSQSLHLEAIFGAFIMGLILSMIPRANGEVLHTIELFTNQFLAPLFFAIAGLKINIQLLADPIYIYLSILVLVVATSSKFIGVYAGARLLGNSSHWPAVFLASGLNARGSMGIIVASIGLSLELLTVELYAMLVLMAVVTSVAAPPMLRATVRRIDPDPEELARLNREKVAEAGFFNGTSRVLIPLRPRTKEEIKKYNINELTVFNKIHEKIGAEATIVSVAKEDKITDAQAFLDQITSSMVKGSKGRVLSGEAPPAFQILDEVKKGYDIVILGVSKESVISSPRAVFSPLVDSVVRLSGCPVILVQGELPLESVHGSRILVPTGGSISSKRATELSFLFLQDLNSELHLLKVVEEVEDQTNSTILQRQVNFGRQVLKDLEHFAEAHNVKATTELRLGPDPETVILETIIRNEIDLLILGTRVRPVGERLYLGPRIEKLLREAKCPVIVLNT